MADGITEITEIDHIDRGYEDITENLRRLGAKIWREKVMESNETISMKGL